MSPDLMLPANVWNNIYAASGIAPGTPILIYGKANSVAQVFEGPTDPGADAWDGVPLIPQGDPIYVDQKGISGCWIKSGASLRISVQVAT